MNESDERLRQAFDTAPATTAPSTEELLAYVGGELDEATVESLLERLADHPAAMDELLALRAAARPTLSSHEAAAGVAKVRSALPLTFSRPAAARPRSFWLGWAAAFLALALTGAGWWRDTQQERRDRAELGLKLAAARAELRDARDRLEGLEGQVEALQARPEPTPIAGLPIVDLYPAGRLRSAEAPPAIAATAGPQVLILTPADPQPGRLYEVELRAGDRASLERVRWQSAVTADGAGAVVLLVPGKLLAAGDWRIELRARGPQTADVFTFRVP